MKISKILTLFAILLVPGAVRAQAVETRKLPAFSTIHSAGSFDTFIDQGNEESVRIEAGGIDPSKIITEVEGGNLKVYLEKGNYNNIRTRIYITYKNLSALSQSGSGKVECRSDLIAGSFRLRSDGSGALDIKGAIKAKELFITIAGSGSSDVRSVETGELNIEIAGSGALDILSGSTETQRVSVSGSGGLNAFGVKSNTASVSVRGSGSADITVEGTLNATIGGSGGVNYKGGAPTTNISASGSGRVRKI